MTKTQQFFFSGDSVLGEHKQLQFVIQPALCARACSILRAHHFSLFVNRIVRIKSRIINTTSYVHAPILTGFYQHF